MSGNKFIQAWRDYDNDRQEVSYDVKDATVVADFTGFFVEVDKWTVGVSAGGGFYDDQSADAGVAASSPLAQNSLQAIMEIRDAVTGRTYSKRVPMPDLAKADDVQVPPESAFAVAGGLTIFNPDHTDYPLLKTEIELHLESPAGNAITLVRIYIEE